MLQPHRFGRFEVLPAQRQLLVDGQPATLGARAFDLLLYLVEHSGRVVGKEELLAQVWPGVVVEENNLTVQISVLRKVLGAEAIGTVAGRGYQFTAMPAPSAAPQEAGPAEAGEMQWPWIAVLPFTNMSDDPAQEYFADGMVDDIITALARTGMAHVIARNSSFVYKGRAVDIKQVGAELGVRYVLEGGVRKAGGQVRVNLQMIDAVTGSHIWADRLDGALEDLFELQDRISEHVTQAAGARMFHVEIARAQRRPTADLQAYDYLLRAHKWLNPSAAPAERREAQLLLQQALARDPQFPLVKALLAILCGWRLTDGHGDVQDVRDGVRLANEALADHRDDPLTLCMAGAAIASLGIRVMGVTLIGFRYDEGLAAVRRALAICPGLPALPGAAGYVHLCVSEAEQAIAHFERARRLNPVGPDRSALTSGIGTAHFIRGRCEDALASAEQALLEAPNNVAAQRLKTIALEALGRAREAQEAARRVLELTPTLTVSRYLSVFPAKDARLRKKAGALLKAAGIPA